MTKGSNADQIDYWNSASGLKWVTLQHEIDDVFQAVSDRLLDRAGPAMGQKILDIGCGAGALSLNLAGRVGPAGSVLAVDIAKALLQRAEERRLSAGLDNLAFREADAQVHPFEPAGFDLAVSRFGVMFFEDPVAAFANIATGLGDGGRMHLAAWSALEENPWFGIPREAAIAVLGKPEPTPPHAPGPLAFADRERVVGILERAGLADCRAELETVVLRTPMDLASVTRLASNIGPAARIMRAFSGTPDDLERIVAKVEEGFRPYATPEGFAMPARINFFSAARA